MNQDNLACLFHNYIAHFQELNDPTGANEKYKWDAVEQLQKCWDMAERDLSDMIKRSFSLSYNLVNNRIVQPASGLVAVARVEPEAVRTALNALLVDTDNADRKQDQILDFVDDINALLEKHFPGKWKYTQDVRAAICYLSMIKPADNYMFKSTPAHYFARYMEYADDIGYGQTFKLRSYYAMCDQLVECIKANPDIIAIDATRNCTWSDPSYHILAYDLIYCFGVYHLKDGMKAPVSSQKASALQQEKNRAQKTAELQVKIEQLQDQIDEIQKQIDALPKCMLEGMTMSTRAFGKTTIIRQVDQYLYFESGGKERQFVLPGCIVNGFLIPDDSAIVERYQREDAMRKKLAELDNRQKTLNRELAALQS